MRKGWLPTAVVAILAAAIIASPTTAIGAVTSSHVLRTNALGVDTIYEATDASGCIVTMLFNSAFKGHQTFNQRGLVHFAVSPQISASVFVVNVCDPEAPATELSCFSFLDGTAELSIDRKLTSALVEGTLTCSDFNTGEPVCELTETEVHRGVGDLRTDVLHFQDEFGDLWINVSGRGQFRDAETTDALITGCGLALTEDEVIFAQLGAVNSGDVLLGRG